MASAYDDNLPPVGDESPEAESRYAELPVEGDKPGYASADQGETSRELDRRAGPGKHVMVIQDGGQPARYATYGQGGLQGESYLPPDAAADAATQKFQAGLPMTPRETQQHFGKIQALADLMGNRNINDHARRAIGDQLKAQIQVGEERIKFQKAQQEGEAAQGRQKLFNEHLQQQHNIKAMLTGTNNADTDVTAEHMRKWEAANPGKSITWDAKAGYAIHDKHGSEKGTTDAEVISHAEKMVKDRQKEIANFDSTKGGDKPEPLSIGDAMDLAHEYRDTAETKRLAKAVVPQFAQQPAEIRQMFKDRFGDKAPQKWAEEHVTDAKKSGQTVGAASQPAAAVVAGPEPAPQPAVPPDAPAPMATKAPAAMQAIDQFIQSDRRDNPRGDARPAKAVGFVREAMAKHQSLAEMPPLRQSEFVAHLKQAVRHVPQLRPMLDAIGKARPDLVK